MSTWWNSQQGEGEYSLQFGTDDKAKYKLVEKAAQMAVDGKTKADFAEVKHGEWIHKPSSDTLGGTDATYDWMCSVCKDTSVDDTNYCPNCGADMRGGKAE